MIRKYLISEEDFVVEEVPLAARRFVRTKNGIKQAEKYTLFTLEKRGMTTESALSEASRKLCVNKKDIGYAGLKDKFAVTRQYITIKGNHEGFESEKIKLLKKGMTNKQISIGDLLGNRFVITLCGIKNLEIKKTSFPNFFGSQRFGADKNNSTIGMLLLRRKYEDALMLMNGQGKHYNALKDKHKLKFFVHSYQSLVFNKALEKYMANHRIEGKKGDIVGYDTIPANKQFFDISTKIMKKDCISRESFAFRDMNMKCRGSVRMLEARAMDLRIIKQKDCIQLSFFLQKGSYGTVFVEYLLASHTNTASLKKVKR